MDKTQEMYYILEGGVSVRKLAVAEIDVDKSSLRLTGGLYLNRANITGELSENELRNDYTVIR